MQMHATTSLITTMDHTQPSLPPRAGDDSDLTVEPQFVRQVGHS
jgi:hypothetical protein